MLTSISADSGDLYGHRNLNHASSGSRSRSSAAAPKLACLRPLRRVGERLGGSIARKASWFLMGSKGLLSGHFCRGSGACFVPKPAFDPISGHAQVAPQSLLVTKFRRCIIRFCLHRDRSRRSTIPGMPVYADRLTVEAMRAGSIQYRPGTKCRTVSRAGLCATHQQPSWC